jgi:hypothetical protein
MFSKRMVVVTLAALALGASGCLALGVGQLAYNYEKTGSITGQTSSPTQTSSKTRKAPSSQATPSPSDIE